jgi:hypothetical protein
MDDGDRGLTPYSGPAADRVRDTLTLLKRKAELRAMMSELQERIVLALSGLGRAQVQELFDLMDKETSAAPDVEQVRQEAAYAAEGIRPLDAKLTRPATKILKAEMVRRLTTGQYCAPTELLISEAVISQFGRR